MTLLINETELVLTSAHYYFSHQNCKILLFYIARNHLLLFVYIIGNVLKNSYSKWYVMLFLIYLDVFAVMAIIVFIVGEVIKSLVDRIFGRVDNFSDDVVPPFSEIGPPLMLRFDPICTKRIKRTQPLTAASLMIPPANR